MSYQIIMWLIPYSDATFSLCKSHINNRFYDRLDRHVTAVDSKVNPGFVVDEIFLNCNDKTVAFLCSTSLF